MSGKRRGPALFPLVCSLQPLRGRAFRGMSMGLARIRFIDGASDPLPGGVRDGAGRFSESGRPLGASEGKDSLNAILGVRPPASVVCPVLGYGGRRLELKVFAPRIAWDRTTFFRNQH